MKVVAAILEDGEGRILLALRPPGRHLAGHWEFPGGKVEPGESSEEALHREMLEELSVTIDIDVHLGTFHHDYERVHLEMDVFCARPRSTLKTSDSVPEFRWVLPHEASTFLLAPADIAPLQAYLRVKT